MADKLIMCYYDGLTRDEAIRFLETSYGKPVKTVSIKTAVESIKRTTGKDWN